MWPCRLKGSCVPAPAQEEKEDLPKFWFPVAGEGYALGEVLHHDLESDNMNIRLQLEEGSKVCSTTLNTGSS